MNILQKYAPVLIFDIRETHFPCTIEFFISTSTYSDGKGAKYFDIDEFNEYVAVNNTFNAKLTPDIGVNLKEDLSKVPTYAFGRLVNKNNDINKSYYDLKYVFLYNYNGNIFCMPCINVGTHLGDFEHITVRVNYQSGKVIKVFFDRHATEGRSIDLKNLTFDKDEPNRVQVFVARESHASYEKPGTTWRIMGFANDNHRGGGEIWKPKISPIYADGYLINEETVKKHKNQWATLYHGEFGTVSPLYNRSWFVKSGDSNQTGNPCWPCM